MRESGRGVRREGGGVREVGRRGEMRCEGGGKWARFRSGSGKIIWILRIRYTEQHTQHLHTQQCTSS